MQYFLKILLMVSVVLYIMDILSALNYVIRRRRFDRAFSQSFKGREEEEISAAAADEWQEYYKKSVVNSFTLFIAFVIPSLIFSVMLVVFNL